MLEVHGTGFLYRQVRAMVAALVDVGFGHSTVEDVRSRLESPPQVTRLPKHVPVAPAHGLALEQIFYDPPLVFSHEDAGDDADDYDKVKQRRKLGHAQSFWQRIFTDPSLGCSDDDDDSEGRRAHRRRSGKPPRAKKR